MSHEELRENLSAFLDGELDEARRRELEGHLDSCESCRRELESLKNASAEFKARGRCPAPVALKKSILERAEGERLRHPALVFAAGLAVIMLLLYSLGKMFKPQISGIFNQVLGMVSGAASTIGH